MSANREPIYLQRRTYRLRRIVDACRVLPFLGAILWLIPLLWPQGEAAAPGTSRAITYMFAVWLGLIGIGALLAWRAPDEIADVTDPAAPVAPPDLDPDDAAEDAA
ncbi:hypothetical protein [Pseudaestuariivita atlantica]|uniref:Uncharacterized protein n=1 Tax=Pseudaestuariivita atlantica TaxID=1317121 RepID=A0A0L1JTK0_9RHOB|nr:hypothetical protein [Pseudaestuariivita atlantica]KNG95007.1 hypothetical protein ATO11_06510 [Pseudaestuariivita atlantica]